MLSVLSPDNVRTWVAKQKARARPDGEGHTLPTASIGSIRSLTLPCEGIDFGQAVTVRPSSFSDSSDFSDGAEAGRHAKQKQVETMSCPKGLQCENSGTTKAPPKGPPRDLQGTRCHPVAAELQSCRGMVKTSATVETKRRGREGTKGPTHGGRKGRAIEKVGGGCDYSRGVRPVPARGLLDREPVSLQGQEGKKGKRKGHYRTATSQCRARAAAARAGGRAGTGRLAGTV